MVERVIVWSREMLLCSTGWLITLSLWPLSATSLPLLFPPLHLFSCTLLTSFTEDFVCPLFHQVLFLYATYATLPGHPLMLFLPFLSSCGPPSSPITITDLGWGVAFPKGCMPALPCCYNKLTEEDTEQTADWYTLTVDFTELTS